jgi:hypothetical protein
MQKPNTKRVELADRGYTRLDTIAITGGKGEAAGQESRTAPCMLLCRYRELVLFARAWVGAEWPRQTKWFFGSLATLKKTALVSSFFTAAL